MHVDFISGIVMSIPGNLARLALANIRRNVSYLVFNILVVVVIGNNLQSVWQS